MKIGSTRLRLVMVVLFHLLTWSCCRAEQDGFPSDLKVFGDVRSFATVSVVETVFFNYTVTNANVEIATVTFWQVVGQGWPNGKSVRGVIDRCIVSLYVDGEKEPSVTGQVNLLHGVAFLDDGVAPFGSSLFGKRAKTGGLANTIRVPFRKNIVFTARMPADVEPPEHFYFTIRGVEGVQRPVRLADGAIALPNSARLKLFTQHNVPYQPLDFVPLAHVDGQGGAVLMVVLAVSSGNMNFLEACVRATLDGRPTLPLSSGLEDWAASGYYFDAGPFQDAFAGLTHKKVTTDPIGDPYGCEVAAYRVYDRDPIVFHRSLDLKFRVGETMNATTGTKCYDDNGPAVADPRPSVVTSYTWVYVF